MYGISTTLTVLFRIGRSDTSNGIFFRLFQRDFHLIFSRKLAHGLSSMV